jgi:hypothetical protein
VLSHDVTEIATRVDDALVCREAALLLRAGEASPDGEDLGPPMDRLLIAVSRALEADRPSIPTTVRRAAVELARHLVRRSSLPVPRCSGASPERTRPSSDARRRRAVVPSRAATPFTPSIKLGRMG